MQASRRCGPPRLLRASHGPLAVDLCNQPSRCCRLTRAHTPADRASFAPPIERGTFQVISSGRMVRPVLSFTGSKRHFGSSNHSSPPARPIFTLLKHASVQLKGVRGTPLAVAHHRDQSTLLGWDRISVRLLGTLAPHQRFVLSAVVEQHAHGRS